MSSRPVLLRRVNEMRACQFLLKEWARIVICFLHFHLHAQTVDDCKSRITRHLQPEEMSGVMMV